MMAPQVEQVGASPMSISSFRASEAWMAPREEEQIPRLRLVMTNQKKTPGRDRRSRRTTSGRPVPASHGAEILGTQAVEERLLLSGEEAQLQPAEDVIHHRLGVADFRVLRPAAGLKAGVGEFLAQQLERYAVLQSDGDGAGEAVHQAADGRAFLGHGDEDLAWLPLWLEADGDVAFVASDIELVGDGEALVGQTMAARPAEEQPARRWAEPAQLNCRLIAGLKARSPVPNASPFCDFAVAVAQWTLSGCAFFDPSR